MFWWLLLAVLLYLLCAVTLVAEAFVPSAGLLSILSLLFLAGGVYIFFQYSPVAGWIGILLAVIMIPTVLVLAYKILPQTRFGRSVILSPPERQQGDAVPDGESLSQLAGRSGLALTPLRPVGTCEINGKRVQCVAETGFIEKGTPVKVFTVEGNRVIVVAVT
jgi:membrane-bound serine protease (ClpP class)